MNLFTNIKQFFTAKPIVQKLSEAYHSRQEEDYGFRSIWGRGHKGISILARDKQLNLVFAMWIKNGFAKRLIEIVIDFIIGDSLFNPSFKSKDGSISEETLIQCKEVITEFVKKNKFKIKFEKFCTDLSLNGSLLLPVTVNEINGCVKIGFIDPSKIDGVKTNPYDILEIETVVLKNDFSGDNKKLKVIKEKSGTEDINALDYNLLSGDCFFYAINNVSNQPEGVSDLLANVDFIEILSELLGNIVDAVRLQNLFLVDVTLEGMDDKAISDWIKKNPLPKRPSRFAHNEKVKQEMLSPGLKGTDNSESMRLLKNFILGNYSLPAMWFADGADANRAIAVEQGTPIFKRLKKRQEIVIGILEDVYTFVIHNAILKREGFNLSREQLESLEIEIIAPAIDTKNVSGITTALRDLGEALDKAESKQWITKETARKTFLTNVNSLGMNIDIETEEYALEEMIDSKDVEPIDPEPNPIRLYKS